MKPAGVGALLLVLSVTLSAAPADRHKQPEVPQQQHRAPGWSLPLRNPPAPSREKRNLMEKRKCNTATCVTQRLADFLVRSNTHHHAPAYSPTNVGSFTYGKRDVVGLLRRESFDYLHH